MVYMIDFYLYDKLKTGMEYIMEYSVDQGGGALKTMTERCSKVNNDLCKNAWNGIHGCML